MSKIFTAKYYLMNGWAAYVWPAYAVTLIILGIVAARIIMRNAKLRSELEMVETRRARENRSAQGDGP